MRSVKSRTCFQCQNVLRADCLFYRGGVTYKILDQIGVGIPTCIEEDQYCSLVFQRSLKRILFLNVPLNWPIGFHQCDAQQRHCSYRNHDGESFYLEFCHTGSIRLRPQWFCDKYSMPVERENKWGQIKYMDLSRFW